MEEVSFIERIRLLSNLITSSPFFIVILLLLITATVTLVFSKKLNNKYIKITVTILYFLSIILIIFNYGNSFLRFFDNLINKLFTYLYFPSIIAYLCLMIIGIFILIKMIISKEKSKFIVVCNIILFTISSLLFILSIDTIVSNNIDIFKKVSLYNNETLMVLIQANTTIYLIWFIILFIRFIVNKIVKKLDEESIIQKEFLNSNENIEVQYLTDEEFNTSFENYKKSNDVVEEIKKMM